MSRNRYAIACLVFCVVSWVLLSMAELNAAYKMEVYSAPIGDGYVPTYREFLQNKGVDLVWYFLPYFRHPIIGLLSLFGMALFFSPAVAAFIAPYRGLHVACVLVVGIFTYGAVEVFLGYEGGDRKGCESCGNLVAVQSIAGLVLLWVAFICRAVRNARA